VSSYRIFRRSAKIVIWQLASKQPYKQNLKKKGLAP